MANRPRKPPKEDLHRGVILIKEVRRTSLSSEVERYNHQRFLIYPHKFNFVANQNFFDEVLSNIPIVFLHFSRME